MDPPHSGNRICCGFSGIKAVQFVHSFPVHCSAELDETNTSLVLLDVEATNCVLHKQHRCFKIVVPDAAGRIQNKDHVTCAVTA